MNNEIQERLEKIGNSDALILFFKLLGELISTLHIGESSEKISITIPSQKNRIHVNLNGRLVFGIGQGSQFLFMVNKSELEKITNKLTLQKETEFQNVGPKDLLLYTDYLQFSNNLDLIKPIWLKGCQEYEPIQTKTSYRGSHVPELYELAMNKELLNKYLSVMNDPISKIIEQYKNHIKRKGLDDEIYKWELVKQYEGRPDVNAPDFYEEIKSINFSNLVYPVGIAVIHHIAKERTEPYRECFKVLFDETKPLIERIKYFNEETLKIYREIVPETRFSHHQDERTIATFLTYHNPEKYIFYKDSFYRRYCNLIGEKIQPTGKKLTHYIELTNNLIQNYILNDIELLNLVDSLLAKADCFPDKDRKLLAQDILFQIFDGLIGSKRNYWRIGTSDDTTSYWEFMKNNNNVSIGWPKIGDLNEVTIISKKEIENLLQTNGYYTTDNKTRSRKAGEIFDFYKEINIGDVVLAQDGASVLGVGIITEEYHFAKDDGFAHQKQVEWQVINPNIKNKEGLQTTVCKLKDLSFTNSIDALLNNSTTSDENNKSDNIMQKDMPLNQILYGPPGTGKTFKLKNEYFKLFTQEKSTQSLEDFYQDLVSNLSWWEVIAAIVYDLRNANVSDILKHDLLIAKSTNSTNSNIRATIWGALQLHTLDECEFVNHTNRQQPQFFRKTKDSMWSIDNEILKNDAPELIDLILKAKSFKPQTLEKKRYVFTTFHQSFSYEDFIEGIKPIVEVNELFPEKGKHVIYDVKPGVFKKIVSEAINDPDNNYAIFIDEINRGNISNIFGELITLIEPDKRIGMENYIPVELPYSGKEFGVPKNLYIIGTMNTADRSVEALDTALRRRFSFVEICPDPERLSDPQFICDGIEINKLLKSINDRIEKLLDKDYCIGHSYFMTIKDRQNPLKELISIFKNNILPLMQEYFYGDWGKIMLVLGKGLVEKRTDTVKFLCTDLYDDYEAYDDKPIYHFTDSTNWTIATFKAIYE